METHICEPPVGGGRLSQVMELFISPWPTLMNSYAAEKTPKTISGLRCAVKILLLKAVFEEEAQHVHAASFTTDRVRWLVRVLTGMLHAEHACI